MLITTLESDEIVAYEDLSLTFHFEEEPDQSPDSATRYNGTEHRSNCDCRGSLIIFHCLERNCEQPQLCNHNGDDKRHRHVQQDADSLAHLASGTHMDSVSEGSTHI